MSTRFWKKCIERLAWLSAGVVFAVGTLVSPATRAEDKPTVKTTPEEDEGQPADKAKTKKKNKDKDKEAEADANKASTDPKAVMMYGIQPSTKESNKLPEDEGAGQVK
jgi:hypothetical protein